MINLTINYYKVYIYQNKYLAYKALKCMHYIVLSSDLKIYAIQIPVFALNDFNVYFIRTLCNILNIHKTNTYRKCCSYKKKQIYGCLLGQTGSRHVRLIFIILINGESCSGLRQNVIFVYKRLFLYIFLNWWKLIKKQLKFQDIPTSNADRSTRVELLSGQKQHDGV